MAPSLPPAFTPSLPHTPLLRRSSFIPPTTPRTPPLPRSPPRRPHQPPTPSITSSQQSPDPPDPPPDNNPDYWLVALEGLFLEALRAYYQGTPIFSDSEFETLRDELDHLSSANLRLATMEQIWVQATSARDFDRRVKEEFQLSQQDLDRIKNKLLTTGTVQRPTIATRDRIDLPPTPAPPSSSVLDRTRIARFIRQRPFRFWNDAEKIEANTKVDQRLKWLFFSDASEERLKILLLYLPAVLMSFVTASVLTILFALLDGEMRIDITNTGRVRLGILSYLVVMLTVWFSNQVTPVMLDYLDLGQPTLIRGDCPICGAPVSCLFTGAARIRDERQCTKCHSTVGFNRKWCKVYLVAPPGSKRQQPD